MNKKITVAIQKLNAMLNINSIIYNFCPFIKPSNASFEVNSDGNMEGIWPLKLLEQMLVLHLFSR